MLLFLFLLLIENGGYLLSHLRSTRPLFSLLRKRAPFHSAWRPSGTAVSLQTFARSNTLYLRDAKGSFRFASPKTTLGVKNTRWDFGSHLVWLFVCWESLVFLAQEDVQEETNYHQDKCSYLNSIVVVPAKEETADEQDGTQNYYDSSQILFKAVHCYVVLSFFFDCKLNGFYPKYETISPFLWLYRPKMLWG